MSTFTTSKSINQSISILIFTSTEYWKYNHDGSDSGVVSSGSQQSITVTNANGEFTIISCLEDGTPNGDITSLWLNGPNQITTFDGTGLSSLTQLLLGNNELTTFNTTGLTALVDLGLWNNQLTTFDGTGLESLTQLNLSSNSITTLDLSSLSNLTVLNLVDNQLTSFDTTGLSSLTTLYLESSDEIGGNQLTTSANNSILDQLNSNNLNGGTFVSINGRTSTGTADYNSLISKGWNLLGLDLITIIPEIPAGVATIGIRGNYPTE